MSSLGLERAEADSVAGRFTQTTQGLSSEIACLPTAEAAAVADRHAAGSVGACDLNGDGLGDIAIHWETTVPSRFSTTDPAMSVAWVTGPRTRR